MRKILFILSCLGLAAPAAQAQEFVFVPEGSSITCTLEEGCQEAGYEYGGLGFDLRGQIEAQPTLLEAARGMMVERAETALETIRGLSPLQLLSEEVARAAIRDRRWDSFRGISYAAREEVFNTHQCDVFEHYPDPAAACWAARAFESSDAEHHGVPAEIMPAVVSMRRELYRVGRLYLMQPTNLHATYERVKPAMLDEVDQLFFAERQELIDIVAAGADAAERLYDPAVAELLAAYHEAEDAWRRDSQRPVELRSDEEPSLFEQFEAARAQLTQAIDLEWILFLNRRHAEGGPELVTAYGDILGDFHREITQEQASAGNN